MSDDLHKFILKPHLEDLEAAIDDGNTAKAVLITVMLVRYKERMIISPYVNEVVQELIDEATDLINSQ